MGIDNDKTWQPQEPQPAPDTFSSEKLFDGVHWHQRWELFSGVFTPGGNPVSMLCDYIHLPDDLRGKRVLDIGAWNGCFSFECERRGAAEVVAFGPDNPEESGFNRLKEILNSQNVSYRLGSVYRLKLSELGEFDIILFLGVLYHLRHPLLALENIRNIARGPVYVETHVMDEYCIPGDDASPILALKDLSPVLDQIPLWRFYRGSELRGDPSNWFSPNTQAVLDAFGSAGFDAKLLEKWGDRASFIADPTAGKPEFKRTSAYEAVSQVIADSLDQTDPRDA